MLYQRNRLSIVSFPEHLSSLSPENLAPLRYNSQYPTSGAAIFS